MPRLDVYRQQQGARNELRVSRNAQPSEAASQVVGETITAIGELGMRIEEGRAKSEAARLEVDARRAYDQAYREIEATPDAADQFESRLVERQREIRNGLLKQVKSGAVRQVFDQRLTEIETSYVIEGRDLSRRRAVETIKADIFGLVEKVKDSAADISVEFFDPERPNLRSVKSEADAAIALIDGSVRSGFIGADVAAEQKARVQAILEARDSDDVLRQVEDKMENGDPSGAIEHFKLNYGRVLPAQREVAEKAFEARSLEVAAVTKADQFWTETGGDYGAFIEKTSKIEDIDERLAIEARGAQLKNQKDAAQEAKRSADLDAGMQYVVEGRSPPQSWFRDADPTAVYTVQERIRSREMRDLEMAGMTAQQRAEAKAASERDYLGLTTLLAEPELAMAGLDAILADPGSKLRYDRMSTDDQNKFIKLVSDTKANGGVPADEAVKAYKDVMALVGVYVPDLGTKNGWFGAKQAVTLEEDFMGVGEGDPGVKRVSATREKSQTAIDLEIVMMRQIREELARTGGGKIDQTRAEQLLVLGFAEAGTDPETGQTKYPVPDDIAGGIIATDARTQIIRYRRDHPAIWSKAALRVRSQYPEAPDALVLEEALKLQSDIIKRHAMDTVSGIIAKPEGE